MKKLEKQKYFRRRASRFTLVELLVSMAVFSVLLLVSMMVVGSAQKLWTRSVQKNSTFAGARVTMEFIASRVQTIVYADEMPFGIYKKDKKDDNHALFFATAMKMDRYKSNGEALDKYGMRFIGFQLYSGSVDDFKGKLYMLIYADEGKNRRFLENFPPFDENGAWKDQCDKIKSAMSDLMPDSKDFFDDESNARNCVEVAENVVSFKCNAYNIKNDAKTLESGDLSVPPYLLEIEITMLDSKESFDRWSAASEKKDKDDIVREFGYTFRRAILLTDRR